MLIQAISRQSCSASSVQSGDTARRVLLWFGRPRWLWGRRAFRTVGGGCSVGWEVAAVVGSGIRSIRSRAVHVVRGRGSRGRRGGIISVRRVGCRRTNIR
jgi:hypothetical protein